jgi:hypothetical protein
MARALGNPVSVSVSACDSATEPERRDVFGSVAVVADKKLRAVFDAVRSGRREVEPREQPLEMKQRGIFFGAALAVEDADACCRLACRLRLFRSRVCLRDENGGAHRGVRAFIGRARHAPHDFRRAEGVKQPAPQIGEETQLAVAAFERARALCGFEVRAHARQQLARGRSFGDEVVRAGGERINLVLFCVARRDDDNRQVFGRRLRAQQTTQRDAAHARQFEIEHDEVCPVLAQIA